MKNFLQRAVALILIFALTLLSGCGKDNIKQSALLSEEGVFSYATSSEKLPAQSNDQPETLSSSSEKSTSLTESFSVNSFFNELFQSTNKNQDGVDSLLSSAQSEHSSAYNDSATSDEGQASAPSSNLNFKGLWISYYEFLFWGSNEEQAKQKFLDMMKKVKAQGYTAVFCHVRANADAFYPSKYFPFAMQLTGEAGGDPGYDPLKIMIWAAKGCGLEFHAWINPYRVSNITTNPDELAEGHIAAEWLTDGSNRAIISGNGIYFNPSSTDVQRLVLYGIREILENYDVDGIHFDDYFYPEKVSKDFDEKQYKKYLSDTKMPLSLADWRRANVNALISAVYRLCHSKKAVFGISPAANMSLDNSHDNYNLLYADIALWMRDEGYIDYILPQLYFGYNHPVKKSQYGYLLNVWSRLKKHKNLKFYVGLGAYRMNEEVDDKAEWHNENDLMARQAIDAKKIGAEGIAVFSYTASMLENEHNRLQIQNMFNAINLPQ